MKVLFLDIDGVLVTSDCEWDSFRQCHKFNTDCVTQLKRVIQETGCQIVVDSTWRLRGLKWIQQFFKHVVGIEILDITKELKGRGEEILEWVSRHDVTKFIAVDDDVHDMGKVPFVNTTWTSGLDQRSADEIIQFFKE